MITENGAVVSPEAIQWLANGQRGLSSEAMFTACLGVDARSQTGLGYYSHPRDPDDLCRCVRLIEAVPDVCLVFREVMPLRSKAWAALIAKWDVLVGTLDREVPDWRTHHRGMAPETFRAMKECEEPR